MPAYVKVASTTIWVLLLLTIFEISESVHNLNKCCRENEWFNENLKCTKIPKRNETNNVSFSRRILAIDEKYDKYNFSSKIGFLPCKGQKNIIIKEKSWFELNEVGLLKLFDQDDNVVANYSRKSYCVEQWDVGDSEILDIAYICPCVEHLCVFKCCYNGMHMVKTNIKDEGSSVNNCDFYDKTKSFSDWSHDLLNGSKISVYYETLMAQPECGDKDRLPLHGEYFLREDGSIVSQFDGVIPPSDYCGDFLHSNESQRVPLIMACVEDEASLAKIAVFSVFSALSVLFLVITVFLHLWLPELSGLHGKCLVAHASCLALGHLWTIPSQVVQINGHYVCYLLGYLMQFSFLASFFWLNIMCIDMSYTFSAIRPTSKGTKRDKDRRKFIWYSIYAWGGSTAFTLSAIIVDILPAVPIDSPFKPNLGHIKCWFKNTESVLLYFYGPMGILLVANLFLFIYTTWRIIVMSRGTDALRKSDSARHGGPSNKERQRYILYAKMFSLMGVTWLTEIISWAVGGPSYIWYLTDFINLLRAVFIFIIFCWKPKVWEGIMRKYRTQRNSIMIKLGKSSIREEPQISDNSGTSTESTECPHKLESTEPKPVG